MEISEEKTYKGYQVGDSIIETQNCFDMKDGKPIKCIVTCNWRTIFEEDVYISFERHLVEI